MVTLEEARARLLELVARVTGGEEIIITQDQQPVAKLVREPSTTRKPRKPGSAKGRLVILHEDDAHLKDFEEYMK
jgi:antitoxin (DNA-binding transcriptional repressor) of toxin-antitoxin stability system